MICPLRSRCFPAGGFRPNKHYQSPGEDLPALKLTPVDTAVPEYTAIKIDRAPAPDAKPAVPHFGEAHAAREVGPAAVATSIEPHTSTPEVCDSKAPPVTGINAVQSTPFQDHVVATAPVTATGLSQPQSLVANSPYCAQHKTMPTKDAVQPQLVNATSSGGQPTIADDEKMSAGHAALIAVTSDIDFQASTPLLHEPDLGPTSSGANDMPLGEKKLSDTPLPTKAEPESQPTRSWWARQNNFARSKPSTPRPSAYAGSFALPTHRNAAAAGRTAAEQGRKAAADGQIAAANGRVAAGNGRAAAAQGRIAAANERAVATNGHAVAAAGGVTAANAQAVAANAPNVSMKITNTHGTNVPSGPRNNIGSNTTAASPAPAYGQTLFGNSNGSMATNSNPTTASAQTNAQVLTAADHAKNDNVVWSKVVQQIKDGVNKTCRSGKPFNGINSRDRTQARVAEALKILRPIILGSTQNTSNVNDGLVSQPAAPVNSKPMQLTMGGAPTQPPPQPMHFMFHQNGTPSQPPPQPPQGMMVWNWAANAWQWTWQ